MAFEAEVARGIALLEDHVPGWRAKVDLDRLDMRAADWSGGCGCICTQVFGSFYRGMRQLHDPDWFYGSIWESADAWEWAAAHGFAAADGRWDGLTAAWRRALAPEATS